MLLRKMSKNVIYLYNIHTCQSQEILNLGIKKYVCNEIGGSADNLQKFLMFYGFLAARNRLISL